MAITHTLIGSVVVGSGGAASMSFTSIPQTYTDLLLVASTRDTVAGAIGAVAVRPNNSSTSLTSKRLYGAGSAPGSDSLTKWIMLSSCSGTTASTFGNGQTYLPNYTSSNNKIANIDATMENNDTGSWEIEIHTGLWANTAAITSLYLYPETAFAQYSTAYLYGIKNS